MESPEFSASHTCHSSSPSLLSPLELVRDLFCGWGQGRGEENTFIFTEIKHTGKIERQKQYPVGESE